MNINWDKIPQTEEEINVARYIENRIIILERLLDVYTQEKLFTLSCTPPPLKGKFYTYEIKYHQHDEIYLINVWKGVRTGDALPILYGHLQNE